MSTTDWARRMIQDRDDLDRLASLPVDEIIAEFNTHRRNAFALRRAATSEISSAGADNSLGSKILKVLKNGPAADIETLRSALFFKEETLSVSAGEVTKAVWSLQKRNLVTFYERKAARASVLHQIKLSKHGLQEMGVLPTKDMTAPSSVKPSRELKHKSPVGKDLTDAKYHRIIAKGGEIERMHAPTAVNGHAQEPTPQNEKPQPKPDYPLIADLIERSRKHKSLQAAADLLDEEGESKMATELREKNHFSAFEEEVLRYVERHS